MYPILQTRDLAPTVKQFLIHAPFVAKKRRAGNFVMLRIDDTGERIPLTIADGDAQAGSITLIVQAVGKTTRQLCSMRAGQNILDVVGPLGKPTPVENFGTVVCIGGGVGTAELLPIARALREAGNRLLSIVGGRTDELVILEEEMRSCSHRLFVTTDDGSRGRKGLVTDQLRDLLGEPIKAIYAIGPLPMMKAVSDLTRPFEIRTFVSLNTIMVDGTGMCGGCRLTVDGEMKFACVDGPEFDGHSVDFEELMMRNKTYLGMEQEASRRYDHECALAEREKAS
jgi:ferredoxin--NADP+ reductase